MIHTVTVRPKRGRSLLELLSDAGFSIPSDCGGNGTCGKCAVRVRDRAGKRRVLACRVVPDAPVRVERKGLTAFRPGSSLSAPHRPQGRKGEEGKGKDRKGLPLLPFRPRSSAPALSSSPFRLALALDLGTTSLSLAAVDIDRGRVVRRREVLNPQVALGADVMTRIARSREVRGLDLLAPVREFSAAAGINPRRRAVDCHVRIASERDQQ